MAKKRANIELGVEATYSDDLAAEAGGLMPHFSDRPDFWLPGQPVPQNVLRPLIEEAAYDVVTAREVGSNRIVGMCTLSLVRAMELAKPEHFLGSFVVLPELRGTGVGDAMLGLVEELARKRGANTGHTSNQTRTDRLHAGDVYRRNGYDENTTTRFHKDVR